jgi:hypothetical protein
MNSGIRPQDDMDYCQEVTVEELTTENCCRPSVEEGSAILLNKRGNR